jgi:predicted nucleic acid-binding protein
MSDAVFVDSTILIYAHDADAGRKRQVAADALEKLWESGTGRLSVQVLEEFHVNATRAPLAAVADQPVHAVAQRDLEEILRVDPEVPRRR